MPGKGFDTKGYLEKEAERTARQIAELPVEKIGSSRFQPRKTFDKNALQELADSVAQKGILEPIIVRPSEDPEFEFPFELIAGERRLRAAKIAGLNTVPALVKKMSDDDAATAAMVENVVREDLTVSDKVFGFASLMERLGSVEQVSRETGVTQKTVRNYLNIHEAVSLQEDFQRLFQKHASGIDIRTAQDFAAVAPAISRLAKSNKREFQRKVRSIEKKGFKATVPGLVRKFCGKESRGPNSPQEFIRETKSEMVFTARLPRKNATPELVDAAKNAFSEFLERASVVSVEEHGEGEGNAS